MVVAVASSTLCDKSLYRRLQIIVMRDKSVLGLCSCDLKFLHL
jgi:hypothetical protein